MDANEIIDAIGGTCAVAELCNVTTGAVSQWRTSGIPAARLMYLKVVRPEAFKESGKSDRRETKAAA